MTRNRGVRDDRLFAFAHAIPVCRSGETGEEMVVYRACYGERGLWVRPLSMRNGLVERDGEAVPRFMFLDEEDACGSC